MVMRVMSSNGFGLSRVNEWPFTIYKAFSGTKNTLSFSNHTASHKTLGNEKTLYDHDRQKTNHSCICWRRLGDPVKSGKLKNGMDWVHKEPADENTPSHYYVARVRECSSTSEHRHHAIHNHHLTLRKKHNLIEQNKVFASELRVSVDIVG